MGNVIGYIQDTLSLSSYQCSYCGKICNRLINKMCPMCYERSKQFWPHDELEEFTSTKDDSGELTHLPWRKIPFF